MGPSLPVYLSLLTIVISPTLKSRIYRRQRGCIGCTCRALIPISRDIPDNSVLFFIVRYFAILFLVFRVGYIPFL